jgi:methylmalonyl-CoA mutase N-terminal domain/subunit
VYADPEETPVDASELFAFDPSIAERQIARTAGRVDARDPGAAAAAIAAVEAVARAGDNVLPPLLDAVRVGATLGELADAFRAAFGEFREPHPW